MEALIQQVHDAAKSGTEKIRKEMLNQLRDLSYSIESSDDTVQRFTFSYIQLAALRIGIDLNLFSFLPENRTPLTVSELAQKTGADPVLLGRILRYLASIAVLKETAQDTFTGTNISQTFSVRGFQVAMIFYFDSMGPAIQSLPEFLKETKYADPKDNTKTALQKGWKTDLPAFFWLQNEPERAAAFNEYLVYNRAGMPIFLDVYPMDEKAIVRDHERPLFVDVGGGLGQQAIAFRNRYPNLPGKVIVQDLPQALDAVLKHPGVEAMAQNFFEAQTVKGAKFYYMRNILHDYPDDKCHDILKNTIDALADDSLILIDDMVLPNEGVHWQAAQLDILMMTSLASRERTTEQWYKLLEGVGLKVNKMYTYTSSLNDSIIEVPFNYTMMEKKATLLGKS